MKKLTNPQLLEIKEKGVGGGVGVGGTGRNSPIARNPVKRDREGVSIESDEKRDMYPQCQNQNSAKSLKIAQNQIAQNRSKSPKNKKNREWGEILPVRGRR